MIKKIDISFNKKNRIYFNVKNIRFTRFFKKLNYKYYDFYILIESIDKMIYKFKFSFFYLIYTTSFTCRY